MLNLMHMNFYISVFVPNIVEITSRNNFLKEFFLKIETNFILFSGSVFERCVKDLERPSELCVT